MESAVSDEDSPSGEWAWNSGMQTPIVDGLGDRKVCSPSLLLESTWDKIVFSEENVKFGGSLAEWNISKLDSR